MLVRGTHKTRTGVLGVKFLDAESLYSFQSRSIKAPEALGLFAMNSVMGFVRFDCIVFKIVLYGMRAADMNECSLGIENGSNVQINNLRFHRLKADGITE